MQQFTAVFMAPITEQIEGQSVEFALLKAKELAPLAEKIKSQRKLDSEKSGEKFKLTAIQLFRAHQEIDATDVSVPELGRWINTQPGAEEAVDLSLKKTGYDDTQRINIIDAMDPPTLVGIAMLVTRFGRLPLKKTSGDAVDVPLTTTGNQTSSTGGSLPGSSADGFTATPETSQSISSGINTAA
jgi:hypothetical protein